MYKLINGKVFNKLSCSLVHVCKDYMNYVNININNNNSHINNNNNNANTINNINSINNTNIPTPITLINQPPSTSST